MGMVKNRMKFLYSGGQMNENAGLWSRGTLAAARNSRQPGKTTAKIIGHRIGVTLGNVLTLGLINVGYAIDAMVVESRESSKKLLADRCKVIAETHAADIHLPADLMEGLLKLALNLDANVSANTRSKIDNMSDWQFNNWERFIENHGDHLKKFVTG